MTDPFAAFNAGVTRARAEYAEHPSVFADPDLCPNCLHPRIRRNCDDCRAADRMRTNRARRKHMNVQTDKPELPPVTKSEARMQPDLPAARVTLAERAPDLVEMVLGRFA